MGVKRHMQWTVFSDDVRTHYIRPLLKHRSLRIGRLADLFHVEKDKVKRISRGEVNRTQAIKGSASIVFDKSFRKTLPDFHIIRTAFLIIDQLRNMRADSGVRPDYIVNTIETGKSHYAAHHKSVTGLAAAVLESMRAALTFTAALYGWGSRTPDEKAREIRDAKALLEGAINMYRAFTNEEDRQIAQTFLPVDYQNLLFVGSELDELDCNVAFDDERNPKTTTRAILEQLEKSAAIEELHQYVIENQSLRGGFNLAHVHGLTGDAVAAEKELLLCLKIQRPERPEDFQVPEMSEGPSEIPYLKEPYNRAWKRYWEETVKERKREEAKKQRERTMDPKRVVALVFALFQIMAGAAIPLLLFMSELLAKPVPG